MFDMDDVLKNLAETLEKEESAKTEPPHDEPETEEYEEDFYEDPEEESEDFEEEEYEDDEDDYDDYDDFDDDEEDRPRLKFPKGMKLVAIIAGALVVVLAAAALWVNANFVLAGGLHSRKAESLDLRDKNLSLKNYEKLSQELPGCEILWNVPMGDASYDCQAKSLTISGINPGEEALFSQFTQLESLDLTAATITPEQFNAIQAKLPGCTIRWSIPIGGSRYASDAKEIALSNLSMGEIALFDYFEQLETVDANSCSNYDELVALQEALPDTRVDWTVAMGGAALDRDTTQLELDGTGLDYASICRQLSWLPGLEEVTLNNNPLTSDEQLQLLKDFPNISFSWDVTLLGKTYSSSETTLSFANRTDLTDADFQAIADNLVHFHALKELDMRGSNVSDATMREIRALCPEDAAVYWNLDILGVAATTADTELDLSGILVEDLAALEETLSYMPNLEKVYMCDCGVSDEDMDALNQKYENTRFVWNVTIGPYTVRTDATGFIGTSDMFVDLTDEDCVPLKYCTDLLALDLGHKSITHLEFVRYMPDLKYLIISRSMVKSFEPVASLKNLLQLEAFLVPAGDLDYLLECPNLKDLHIAYIGVDRDDPWVVDTLSQMTTLERLWYGDNLMTDDDELKLKAALPNCRFHEIYKRDHVFQAGWREHERYYEMRDILGMFYMNSSGIEVPYKVIDGEWVFPEDERY